MTEKITKAPGWLMFILLITPFLIASIIPSPLCVIISLSVYCIWLYSLGFEAHKKNNHHFKIPFTRFKYSVIYAGAYGLVSNIYIEAITPYVIPFHLLAMACIFYSFYYIAKTIRTVELKKSATFQEWAILGISLWFFPVGVWFLQKKMKKL